MFNQFKKFTVEIEGLLINYVIGGSGPAILLLHGYPQTHVMWHRVADQLAEHYTVVASDLRGYGDSDKPPTNETHTPYSKRASRNDQVKLMQLLGFNKFQLVGHDRGGRVGHRMALDHPDVIKNWSLWTLPPLILCTLRPIWNLQRPIIIGFSLFNLMIYQKK